MGYFACAGGLVRLLVSQCLLISAACHLGSIVIRPQQPNVTVPGPGTTASTSNSIESRTQALSKLTADRDRLRQTDDLVALVRTVIQIGELHLKLNDLETSLRDAKEALTAARQSRDETLLVAALNFTGRVHRYRQDNQTAVNLLNEARTLSLHSKNAPGEAQALTELGTVYLQQSRLPKARECNDRALKIWRELQDKRGEARTLTNQGEVYIRQEDAEQAANALDSAANIWRSLNESTELANTLLDINFLAIRQGQWQKALSTVNEAQLLVTDKEAEPYLAGQIATSLGEAYEAFGQIDTALEYFQEALVQYRDHAHDDSAAIDAGRQVGRVRARLGDYTGAAQQVEQALKRADEIDADYMSALCHEELGKVWLAAGSYDQAHPEFLKAIALYQRTGNRRPWARAQTFLGETEYLQGNLESASTSYNKALRFFKDKQVQDYTNEAALCFGLGKLRLRQQRLDQAGTYLERSIALTERLRENASSKDLRSSFLASVHDRYETYVEWLMQSDAKEPGKHAIAAFEASERGRARSLLDSLKDSQRELRKVANPKLLLDEEKLQREEQRLLDEQAKLQSEGSAREARLKLDAELKQARTRREMLAAEINTTAKFNDLIRALPLGFDEIRQQITDADTSLLEYSLGDQTSYLWLITPSGMTSYKLPEKNTVEKAVRKLLALLAKPHAGLAEETELQSAISEVSVLLLTPVREKLSSTRLIIVPDGILQYIPFQILASPLDPNEPLVARHEIVNAPSASTLAVVRREAINREVAPRLLAALGDPVLPSNYLSKAAEPENDNPPAQRGSEDREDETLEPAKLGPLFFARHELNELRKLAGDNDSIVYSGFAATRDNLRGLDLRQYRILHFATHGFFDAKQPELSGLVLSLVDRNGRRVNGFVGLSDIYNLRAPVDLVVLSACRTALGKEVRGEGLVGLTRGFMYAGASTVVASLWKVDDEATAELMKRFYTNMLQHGMTPAAALRAAQNSVRQEPHWHSPYYWGAFTLQGDYHKVIAASPKRSRPTYFLILTASLALLLVIFVAWRYRRNRAAIRQ